MESFGESEEEKVMREVMMAPERLSSDDLERGDTDEYLANSSCQELSWLDVSVTVKDRKTKRPKDLLRDVHGAVRAGQFKSTN